ncbi:class I histocompatibility antigen, F10 alpha chain-like isoform X2 [Spea bombifrons]|uniref:class I histocompatibility antigen, F10 alpha chain-like isoform X2 n=1 Tax=Spea bombifrons TaxID=233779 RepID=UPI0023496536|nr:class I histocompatibility antigen, F10 alpha chain-like isoform X2 [Spea bombifrons]
MWPLLLIVGVSGVYCGHSLQYYYTTVSAPGHGLPEFSILGYVDGIQILNYNSDRGRAVSDARWMEKEGPEYCERQTLIGKSKEAIARRYVTTAMSRFNHTGGETQHCFHSYQEIFGCELRDDGSTGGYDQDGYDGEDFLVLDTERWVYVPAVAEAVISAQRSNSPEERERIKNLLEIACIEDLKKFIENGREELERRVAPEVKVSAQTSEGATKLHCQVYGFYPRDVDVNWKRNEIDIPSDEAKQVLPNTDGTYQIRVTVEVTPKEGDSYSCHVDHGSLEEPRIVMWDPRKGGSSSAVYIVIGVVAGIAVAAAVGFILWKRRGTRPVYTPTGTSDGTPAASTT